MKPRGTNDTIEFLLKWGTALGFHAEENYMNPEVGTIAEVAWFFHLDQKPVFTFNVETDDPMRLTEKMLQWAGTSTEPESWMHIGVVKATAAKKPAFINLPPRMRVFNGDDQENFRESVEELVRLVTHLLRRYCKKDDEQSSVKMLVDSMEGWPKRQLDARIILDASSVAVREGVFAFARETEDDEEAAELVLTPSRKVVPLDISAGAFIFDGALIRLTNAAEDFIVFSSEHRNLPFTFLFNLSGDGEVGSVNLWLDADKSNPPQALLFWELVEAARKVGWLKLTGSAGDVAFFTIDQGSF
jgi:hypothetical protein